MHTQTPQGTPASRTLSKDHFVPAGVGLESAYPRVLGFFHFSWKWYLGRGDGIPLEHCGFAFIHEGLFQRNSIGITLLWVEMLYCTSVRFHPNSLGIKLEFLKIKCVKQIPNVKRQSRGEVNLNKTSLIISLLYQVSTSIFVHSFRKVSGCSRGAQLLMSNRSCLLGKAATQIPSSIW